MKKKTYQKSYTYIFDSNKNSEHFHFIYYISFISTASYNADKIYGALRAKPPAFPFVNWKIFNKAELLKAVKW